MTLLDAAPEGGPGPSGEAADYQPGVCNIGPSEIARRRRAGHLGLAVTVGLFAGLVLTRAPRATRLVVVLPAATAASGYLQARLRFCAGFGSRGVYNFGEFGEFGDTVEVAGATARARDRATSTRNGLASIGIGALAGLAAVAVPR
jgi:hypothetical protein